MSIADKVKVAELERRVTELEALVNTMSDALQEMQNRELTGLQSRQTLTLPEKRKPNG
jgi:hypothetical protein